MLHRKQKVSKKIVGVFAAGIVLLASDIMAQDSSKVHFTTGIGVIKSPGSLANVLGPSIAFSSGLELIVKNSWFLQGTFDLNMLKYNQRIREDNSPYLFQNTNSSLVMIGLNGGKNYHFGQNKWLASFYAGSGYLNIGEPRLTDQTENSIRQEVSRKASVFGKIGTRIGYKTKVKFLQTIYFDAAYWDSPLSIQGAGLSGLSLSVGIRMGMQ